MNEDLIRNKIQAQFKTQSVDVINDSQGHHRTGVNTHFRVVVVSEDFVNLSRIQRQQAVMNLFKEDLRTGPLHSLSLKLLTSAESEKKNLEAMTCHSKN